jgi:hypothetical protein
LPPNLGLAYVSSLVQTEEEDEEREREAMGDGARFFICSPRSSCRGRGRAKIAVRTRKWSGV